jgi:hypothetical protein
MIFYKLSDLEFVGIFYKALIAGVCRPYPMEIVLASTNPSEVLKASGQTSAIGADSSLEL